MLQNRDFRNSIQETELIEMQKVRVRRDRPNGITWAFALAVTMLFVYLATLAIPEKDAEPVGAQITRGIQLEPVSAAFVSLGAYPDALNARVAAAEFMQRGAAGFVLMHEGKFTSFLYRNEFSTNQKKRYEIRTICLYNLYTITKATFISVFNKFYSHHSLYLHSLSFHLMQKRSK